MFFLVSVSSEVFDRVMAMRALYRRLGIDDVGTRDTPRLFGDVRRSFGGRVVLIDWITGRCSRTSLRGSHRFAMQNGTVIACSWIDQCVYVLNGSDAISSVTHPWFNYIHSVDLTPQNTFSSR